MRSSSLRNLLTSVGRIVAFAVLCGWSTVASSEPPTGYPGDKSAWQITFEKGAGGKSRPSLLARHVCSCSPGRTQDEHRHRELWGSRRAHRSEHWPSSQPWRMGLG